MKLRYIIKTGFAFLASAFLVTSCLDKYPSSAIPEDEAMQTFTDAEQHLIGIYSSLLSGNLYSGSLTLLPDIQSDMVHAVEGFSNTYGDFWQWKIRSTDSEIKAVYASLYSVIGDCNFFLDRIDAVAEKITDDNSLEVIEDMIGQVYAIRALCYSELVKCFCKAYDPATAKDELGVMIRSRYFEDEPAVRSSLYDTYDFILKDLEKAEEMLNAEDVNNTANSDYFTLVAAWALHARVALYMQDWDAAIEYSSKLIDEKKSLYRLASTNALAADGASEFDFMWAYDSGPEVILRIGFTTSAYGSALGSVFLGFTRDFYYFYPDYMPSASVLNSFSAGDLRRDSYFADASSNVVIGNPAGMNWPLLVKYYGNRSLIGVNATTFMHVSMPKPLRLAEQYLIRAEAYCRKGEYAKASSDLTALHSKRFSSGGAVSLTADNWLETVSDERMKELYMEGFRLHDLKRWGMGFEREYQSFALEEGSRLKISADNPLFVWPIPQHELEVPGSQILPNESNK